MRTLIAIIATVVIACPSLSVAADATAGGANEVTTTVKGSKSNSDNRLGAPGGGDAGEAATTVKGSKSNSSERTGGSGGGGNATSVKSSKSNGGD